MPKAMRESADQRTRIPTAPSTATTPRDLTPVAHTNPLPQCKIVHAEDLGCGKRWGREPADHAQRGIAADREA